jgi:hypothetical protein
MARFDSSDRLDAGLRFDQPGTPAFPIPKPRKTMSLFILELRSKNAPAKLALGTAHITAEGSEPTAGLR